MAIGDYGIDVLDKLANSQNNTYIKDHQQYHTISGNQEIQMKNGGLSILYYFTVI